jgi:DNA-directed RNA polymerase subunit RPC12/RpoP
MNQQNQQGQYNHQKINYDELGLQKQVNYICGGCGEEAARRPYDDLACENCGSVIMFKKRRNSGI